MAAPADRITWQVIQQTPTTGGPPGGPYVRGVEFTYKLSSGQQGSVFVPAPYTEKSVADAINQHASLTYRTSQLSGEVM